MRLDTPSALDTKKFLIFSLDTPLARDMLRFRYTFGFGMVCMGREGLR